MPGETKEQTFSFDTVAVLVAALQTKGVTLGMKDFDLMSKLDGSRGASAFDHMFRKIKARAKELNAENGGGEDASSTKATKGGKKEKAPKQGEGKKGGKRGRETPIKNRDEDDDIEESPSKKVKSEDSEEDAQVAEDLSLAA